MPKYTQALSLNRDIALTGDVNCDLLTKIPRGDALRSFCISVNAKQLIEKPTSDQQLLQPVRPNPGIQS